MGQGQQGQQGQCSLLYQPALAAGGKVEFGGGTNADGTKCEAENSAIATPIGLNLCVQLLNTAVVLDSIRG